MRDETNYFDSKYIPVNHFKNIFIWPLNLAVVENSVNQDRRQNNHSKISLIVGGLAKSIADGTSPWKEIEDPLYHVVDAPPPTNEPDGSADKATEAENKKRAEKADKENKANAYAEFVYFHEFVQKFLFQKTQTAHEFKSGGNSDDISDVAPFYLFGRDDISHLEVDLETAQKRPDNIPARRVLLEVQRCNLYLFRNGSAALVVEVCGGTGHTEAQNINNVVEHWAEPGHRLPGKPSRKRPLMLRDVLDFSNKFRCTFVPYWEQDSQGNKWKPGQGAAAVHWLGADEQVLSGTWGAPSDRAVTPPQFETVMTALNENAEQRAIEPFFHWLGLLPVEMCVNRDKSVDHVWRTISDERIPVMSYISLTNTDASIGGEHLYYNSLSRGDFMRLCFMDYSGKSGQLPYDKNFLANFEAEHCYDRFASSGSRHMFAGYSYVVIGAGKKFFDKVLRTHFRRHYFQMALLAQFEFTSYLAFSSRISEAVTTYEKQGTLEHFRLSILAIQREFLQFVHRFRFTGISNQVQAIEMFDLWRQHLGLEKLYADLRQEIASASGFVFADQTSESTRRAEELALSANRLSKIATVGLIFTIALSFLGINLFFTDDLLAQFIGLASGIPPGSAELVSTAEKSVSSNIFIGHMIIFSVVLSLASILSFQPDFVLIGSHIHGHLKLGPIDPQARWSYCFAVSRKLAGRLISRSLWPVLHLPHLVRKCPAPYGPFA